MIATAFEWIRGLIDETTRDIDRNGRRFAVLNEGQEVHEVVTTAPGRRHTFHDVADFAAHLNRHAEPGGTDILFDGPAGKVVAWYQPRIPGSDLVVCELRLHPRWARWKGILGETLDQRSLYRFLMACPREDSAPITAPDGEILGLMVHDLASAAQRIKIAKGTEASVELDQRGNYRVRDAKATTETSIQVPHAVEIRVPIYRLRGVDKAYTIEVEVDLNTDTTPCPAFMLTAPGLDLVLDEAQQDAAAFLREQLLEGFLVGLGSHATAEVPI